MNITTYEGYQLTLTQEEFETIYEALTAYKPKQPAVKERQEILIQEMEDII